MPDKVSLFKISGLPDVFGALLLAFALILLLSPYFSGGDFGVFKVPAFTLPAKKWLKVVGPGFFISCILCFIPLIPIAPRPQIAPPHPSPRELEFDQLLQQVDEQVHKPFEKWRRSFQESPPNCDTGSQIATRAQSLAEKIEAFNTEELGSYRITKAMAKHEYLAMIHAWAAAISTVCKDKMPDGTPRTIAPARRTLAEYDNVLAMRRELFAQESKDPNSPRLREIAMEIEKITTWYAGRAACILFLHGYYDYAEASRLAQLAHDLFPEESDQWIDQVRNMHLGSK